VILVMTKQILKYLAAVVLAALLFVGVAVIITWENASAEWHASPHERRAWAEEAYLHLTDPKPTAGDPRDAKYHYVMGDSELDDSDPKKARLNIEIQDPKEEFEPKREIVRFNIRDEFSVGGVRGKVKLVGTTDPSKIVVEGQPQAMLFFNGELEEVVERSELAELVGQEKGRFHAREVEQGSYRLFVRFELEGLKGIHWDPVAVFNKETGCEISNSHTWTTKGSVCWFSADLWVLHDPAIEVVMDVTHGDPAVSKSPLKLGEVFNDGEVSVEIAGIFKGKPSTWGASHDDGGEVSARLITGDSTLEACSISYVVNPPAFADSIEFGAIDADGKAIRNSGGANSDGGFLSSGFYANPDEIDRVVISRRSNITRLIAELDRLPGVRSENVEPTDLLDLTMPVPMESEKSSGRMGFGLSRPWVIGSILQFGEMHGRLPAPTGTKERTVREFLHDYVKSNPSKEVVIDPKDHTISVIKKTPVVEGAWNRVKAWLKL